MSLLSKVKSTETPNIANRKKYEFDENELEEVALALLKGEVTATQVSIALFNKTLNNTAGVMYARLFRSIVGAYKKGRVKIK